MDHMDFLIFSWLGHLEFAWFLTSDLHIKCTSTTKTSVLKNFVLPSVSAFFSKLSIFLVSWPAQCQERLLTKHFQVLPCIILCVFAVTYNTIILATPYIGWSDGVADPFC